MSWLAITGNSYSANEKCNGHGLAMAVLGFYDDLFKSKAPASDDYHSVISKETKS